MYAILGILNISPSTGYDIKKYSDKVLSGFWNENFGHIYPTLKRLLKEEMIEIISTEKDKKVLYGITEKGKEELKTWLIADTVQQPVRSEFMLKLLFSSNQPVEKIIQMMKNYKEIYVENRMKYLKMQAELEQGIKEVAEERCFFLNAVLRRGILSSEAVIQWCDETIEELEM